MRRSGGIGTGKQQALDVADHAICSIHGGMFATVLMPGRDQSIVAFSLP